MSTKTKLLLVIAVIFIGAGGIFLAKFFFTNDAPQPVETLRSPQEITTSTVPPIERPDANNPLRELDSRQEVSGAVPREESPEPPASFVLPDTPVHEEDTEENTQHAETESMVPSTTIPDLVAPPQPEELATTIEKDGKVVKLTIEDTQEADSSLQPTPKSILETTSVSDGVAIASSQDSTIPFSLVQSIARDVVNGYWPQGTHVLAASSGNITTNLAVLNTRYGAAVVEQYSSPAKNQGFGQSRQSILNYVLMPSMVEGLYQLYAERFIRLINHEAKARLYLRQGAGHHLSNVEIAEMYALYAQSLRSNAGCIRAFLSSQEIRYNTEKFILAEQDATAAYMAYQEETLAAEESGKALRNNVEQNYRIKVVRRENARQNLAAAFRRFTDTRNMDTSDLVFLAKWLNRRSTAHRDGLSTLAATLETLAVRMEREKKIFLTQ